MHKLQRWALVCTIVGALAVGIWYFARPRPVQGALATVERGMVERTIANPRAATVTACRRAKLAPPSGGQIAKLLIREGDRVKQGQVLLELWSEDLRAQLHLA